MLGLAISAVGSLLLRFPNAKADALIAYARKVKDWPLLGEAIEGSQRATARLAGGWIMPRSPPRPSARWCKCTRNFAESPRNVASSRAWWRKCTSLVPGRGCRSGPVGQKGSHAQRRGRAARRAAGRRVRRGPGA